MWAMAFLPFARIFLDTYRTLPLLSLTRTMSLFVSPPEVFLALPFHTSHFLPNVFMVLAGERERERRERERRERLAGIFFWCRVPTFLLGPSVAPCCTPHRTPSHPMNGTPFREESHTWAALGRLMFSFAVKQIFSRTPRARPSRWRSSGRGSLASTRRRRTRRRASRSHARRR